jgi:inorganic pyrophosphatase
LRAALATVIASRAVVDGWRPGWARASFCGRMGSAQAAAPVTHQRGGELEDLEDLVLDFDVLVEIPKGSRNKYEVDHESGRIRLDRTLFTSTQYPADYGYIENTLGLDGDPLDALVLLIGEPTFPGCLIRCRAIGMYRMTDEAGGDDKVLCVPVSDPRLEHMRDINHLPKFDRLEIEHFFTVYKELEPGKSVEGANWVGRAEAEEEVEASFARLRKSEGTTPAR